MRKSKERHEAQFPQALTQPDDMNLDDESYLSAYLDDELDPADRLAVEWSIESSPPLAEQLRSLGMARDAVAGLDRPAVPRDLAPIVGARLAANRRKARFSALVKPARVVLAASSFGAVAASLLFAIILLNRALHNFDRPKLDARPAIATDDQARPVEESTDPSTPIKPEPALVESKKPSTDLERSPIASHPSPEEVRDQNTRGRLAGVLDLPVRRIVIVTDVLDASDRVRELVHQDARKNPDYYKISICQEIVIDPERAEAAEVYAVPMDEQGRKSFVERLSKIFPDLVEAGEPSPDLLTQLTEVGQVALFRGTEAAPLRERPGDPRSLVATQTTSTPDQIVHPDRGTESLPRADDLSVSKKVGSGKTLVRNPEEVVEEFVGPPAPPRIVPLKPGDPVLVLVWVTRPMRH